MPPSRTAIRLVSCPAAISSRAARALVRSSTHAQYRMSVRSGGSAPVGGRPWAASIVAGGGEAGHWHLVRCGHAALLLGSRERFISELMLRVVARFPEAAGTVTKHSSLLPLWVFALCSCIVLRGPGGPPPGSEP